MNIEYIKYAIEIAKTQSINKAADNLFISQPNLSRTINKLEEDLGFKIFERSAHGIGLTIEGEDFISHAEKLMDEYDQINAINRPDKNISSFSISVPKAAYITSAFTNFVSSIKDSPAISIDYKESSALGAIGNILNNGFNLGIIRYEQQFSPIFKSFLEESGLVGRQICEFEFLVAFSKDNPLATKENLCAADFTDYLEISHGDSYLPYGTQYKIAGEVLKTSRKIRVYDSMGQLSMLGTIPNSFMIVAPLEDATMEKYHLTQRRVDGISRQACDQIIYKKRYHHSSLDSAFVEELQKQVKLRRKILH